MNENFDVTYKALFRRYYPSLIFYATRLVGEEEAEDVVQDVFVELWKRKDHIDQTGEWSASAHIRRNFIKRFETGAGNKSIRFLSAGCKLSAGLDECGSTGRNV